MKKLNICFVLLILCSKCALISELPQNEKKNGGRINLQLGINHGGVVENTVLSLIENTEVDAFTGATAPSVYSGVHYEYPLGKQSIEAGFDVLFHQQNFTIGPLIRLQLTPFYFDNQLQLGFQIEMFRTFIKVYDNFYHIGSALNLCCLSPEAV